MKIIENGQDKTAALGLALGCAVVCASQRGWTREQFIAAAGTFWSIYRANPNRLFINESSANEFADVITKSDEGDVKPRSSTTSERMRRFRAKSKALQAQEDANA